MSSTIPEDFVPIHGQTYPVKDKIKEMGGRWNAQEQCWYVPRHAKMAAEVLAQQSSYEQTRYCFACGAVFTFEQCLQQGGDWDGGWCGCTETPSASGQEGRQK